MSLSTREIKLTQVEGRTGWMRTNVPCPGKCNFVHHLIVEKQGEHWVAWCGCGPCESYAANDGFVADTPEKAIDGLIAMVEEEK